MKKEICISREYPAYWEYDGKPVLLLGGSIEDNLFQIPDLKDHLELLSASGGNYVRCTMSSRVEGNVWPYEMVDGNRYDLCTFSKEYWKRFSDFLQYTYDLDIIVQIEVWDRFDFAREPWRHNPFNPKNNCNYTKEESLLAEEINTHPGQNESRFFFSIPEEDNNECLLGFQKAYVDQLLSYSLQYPHILYCMDNETCGVEGWGRFWTDYIKDRAAERGKEVHTTEMWDAWNLMDEQHKRTFDHPELYSFCDVSQNNHNVGDDHWNQLQMVRAKIKSEERPLNNVKIYGSDDSAYGSKKDGMERFFRNILGRAASARFHRPPSGIGLSKDAQSLMKSARMLTKEIDIFSCYPHNDLFYDRKDDLCFCAANPDKEALVFFTKEGSAGLDSSRMGKRIMVRWLDIFTCQWVKNEEMHNTHIVKLNTPLKGMQAAVIKSLE